VKLLRVETEGVRALANGVYSFAHPTSGEAFGAVLVTGPTGSGKTTLLEAILTAKERAAGYGAPPNPRGLLRRGEANGRVSLGFLLSEAERAQTGLTDPIQELEIRLSGVAATAQIDPRLKKLLATISSATKLVYFGSSRRLEPDVGDTPESARDAIDLAVSRAGDKYAPVLRWIARRLREEANAVTERLQRSGMAMMNDAPDTLGALRDAVARLSPELRLHGLSPDGRTPWFEKSDGTVLSIDALSDGERDAVLLAGAWAMLELSRSIVLIDRPDLFTGDDASSRLAALRSLTAEGQIIAAVTSERMLASIPPHQVLRLGR
jgi:energy-coupling factor transporter ATP-binding protein EcfA2